ncbi:MAG: hypothetical protein EHM89_19940, partial [Acidobacteria bacterium]
MTSPRSDLGPAEIVLRLTAVIVLMRPMGPWGVRPLLLGLAGLAIVLPRVLRAPATWYALAALVSARIVADWPLPDNHVYLLAYWCLALALALGAEDGQAVINRSSRLLVGFAFLMAIVWKVALSPDYLDGRFFHVTLLTDERFEDVTLLFGGLTPQQLDDSREYLQPLPEGAELLDEPSLAEPRSFRVLAAGSTWGLLAVEASVALFCLFPLSGRAVVIRHLLLLLFCVVTYAFAPVAGFGWLLLTMGLAGCGSEQGWLRSTYI